MGSVSEQWSRFWYKRIPILSWLPQYNLHRDLKFDLIAGCTVGVMLVPQEMSLAAMMGVSVQYGLYSAAIAPLIYPMFGSSKALSVANAAEGSLLVGVMLRSTDLQSAEERIATGILLTFFMGVVMILGGVAHQGGVVSFFSRTSMQGYVTGMSFLIVVSQIPPWLGIRLPSPKLNIFTAIDVVMRLGETNLNSFLLGVFSLVVLALCKWCRGHLRRIAEANSKPTITSSTEDSSSSQHSLASEEERNALEHAEDAIEVQLHGSLDVKSIRSATRLDGNARAAVTPVLSTSATSKIAKAHLIQSTSSLPQSSSNSSTSRLEKYLAKKPTLVFLCTLVCDAGALLVCFIGIVTGAALGESQLQLTGEELLGIGFANLGASILQGMPLSAGMVRSAVNAQSAHTPLASMFTAGLVIFTILFLTKPLYYLPQVPLAAIVLLSASALAGFAEPKWLRKVRPHEFYVWVAEFVGTLCFGLILGLFVSLFASLIEIMVRTKKPPVFLLGQTPNGEFAKLEAHEHDEDSEQHHAVQPLPDVLIVRMEQDLYFANASHLIHATERNLKAAAAHDHMLGAVIDDSRMNDVDATAIHMLTEYCTKLRARPDAAVRERANGDRDVARRERPRRSAGAGARWHQLQRPPPPFGQHCCCCCMPSTRMLPSILMTSMHTCPQTLNIRDF
ncbi:Sulfate permease, partial [Globisporangium splendens]